MTSMKTTPYDNVLAIRALSTIQGKKNVKKDVNVAVLLSLQKIFESEQDPTQLDLVFFCPFFWVILISS